ncbi:unnamed protein product [Schistosoma turkestanicum]|nr:unnamed protein product [Schistosoma turkestanicum]
MQELNDLTLLTNPSYFHYLNDFNKLDNNNYQMNKSGAYSEDSSVSIFPSNYINSDDFFKKPIKIDQSSVELSPAQSIQTYLMNTALWNTLKLDQLKQQCYQSNEHLLNETNSSQQINTDTVKDFTNYNFKKRKKINEHLPSTSSFNCYDLQLNSHHKTENYLENEEEEERRKPQSIVNVQYENQSLNRIHHYPVKYMTDSHVNHCINNDIVEKCQSLPRQNIIDEKLISSFICPICQSEIKQDDLENHFKFELEKMQNFTITLPEGKTSSDISESPNYSQHKIDQINSDSRFEIFKKIKRNRKERKDKYLEHSSLLNPSTVQNETSQVCGNFLEIICEDLYYS